MTVAFHKVLEESRLSGRIITSGMVSEIRIPANAYFHQLVRKELILIHNMLRAFFNCGSSKVWLVIKLFEVGIMAGFDPELDKGLFEESAEFERTRITVAIKSYNEGIPKVQISRENKRADGEFSFAKLGRMTKDELEAVMPLLHKALDFMNQ